MTLSNFCRFPLLAFTLTFLGCGGGGGGSLVSTGGGGGIGGSGAVSSGTIDGFGSIFVNGVEFETGEAVIEINGVQMSEGDLRLGMVVVVTGSVNPDGTTGTALQVIFDDDVKGPVASIVLDADGDSLLLTVLGIEVIVERTSTVFEGVTFNSLVVGDVVEVSGFLNGSGQFRATRVEREGTFVPGESEVEVSGVVTDLAGATFMISGVLVDFSSADLSGLPGGLVENGLLVEVEGVLVDGVIQAGSIEAEDSVFNELQDGDDVSLLGTITNFSSISSFQISGILIDGGQASISPVGLSLENGDIVEVEGVWNGSSLQAQKIEARRGRVEIEARVAAVDSSSVTLQLAGGVVQVSVDQQTLLDDETGQSMSLRLDDIQIGDFLAVEAIIVGDNLVATRIDRDQPDEDKVQAPVEAFEPGLSITLLGITYSTVGADFEDGDDNPLDSNQFYAALEVGMLVKIEDEQVPDGTADEVEIESEFDLDGESEFEDDESEDDESEDDESEDDESEDDESEDDESEDDANEDDENEDDENEDEEDDEDDEDEDEDEDEDDEDDEDEDDEDEDEDED